MIDSGLFKTGICQIYEVGQKISYVMEDGEKLRGCPNLANINKIHRIFHLEIETKTPIPIPFSKLIPHNNLIRTVYKKQRVHSTVM